MTWDDIWLVSCWWQTDGILMIHLWHVTCDLWHDVLVCVFFFKEEKKQNKKQRKSKENSLLSVFLFHSSSVFFLRFVRGKLFPFPLVVVCIVVSGMNYQRAKWRIDGSTVVAVMTVMTVMIVMTVMSVMAVLTVMTISSVMAIKMCL